MHPRDGPDYHLTTMFGTIYFKEERVKMPPTLDPYGPPSLPGLRSDLLLGLPNPKVSLSNFSAFPHGFYTGFHKKKTYLFFDQQKKQTKNTSPASEATITANSIRISQDSPRRPSQSFRSHLPQTCQDGKVKVQ